jgi:hypothetical protein
MALGDASVATVWSEEDSSLEMERKPDNHTSSFGRLHHQIFLAIDTQGP